MCAGSCPWCAIPHSRRPPGPPAPHHGCIYEDLTQDSWVKNNCRKSFWQILVSFSKYRCMPLTLSRITFPVNIGSARVAKRRGTNYVSMLCQKSLVCLFDVFLHNVRHPFQPFLFLTRLLAATAAWSAI